MGLFIPIIGGIFCLAVIAIGVFAFVAVVGGLIWGVLIYLITGGKDVSVLSSQWLIATALICLLGAIAFIALL